MRKIKKVKKTNKIFNIIKKLFVLGILSSACVISFVLFLQRHINLISDPLMFSTPEEITTTADAVLIL